MMSNLTITIDAEVLKQARIRALQEGTSVNARVGGLSSFPFAPGFPLKARGNDGALFFHYQDGCCNSTHRFC